MHDKVSHIIEFSYIIELQIIMFHTSSFTSNIDIFNILLFNKLIKKV
jgi:hypothetical protein